MFIPDREDIVRVMKEKGYAFFEKGCNNLNIIGIRNDQLITNAFDDTLCCIYRNVYGWVTRYWRITTDPGRYYAEHPCNDKGTAVLVPGQYRGAFTLGWHKGRYEALVQYKPVTVYRDNNKDHKIDTGRTETGMFGINIHKAGRKSVQVDRWSAGCQVFAVEKDFDDFMRICEYSAVLYGPVFTYTLLERKDFE